MRIGRVANLAALAFAALVWAFAGSILWRTKVPADLAMPSLDEVSVFGARLVQRARDYERFVAVDWILGTLAGLVALLWMVRRGPRLAAGLGLGRVNAGIVTGAVTLTVVWAVSLPFGLAHDWWQRRHGLSTQPYAASLALAWGALLLTTLVGFGALAVVLLLAKQVGGWWWVAATPPLVGVFVVLQLLAPYVLSYDAHSLRDPRLRAEVRTLEEREGAGHPEVLEQKVSGTTAEANAYAVGIGPTERVVFWDTLLDGRFSNREVRFVAGHELAHLARDHIAKSVAWFALFVVPILAATALVTQRRGGLLEAGAVPLALLVITAAQLAALPLQNAISRRYEAEADWVGLSATRDPAAARGLFQRFARTSLQDPSPPWWIHLLLDDHPPLLARAEQAAAWRARNP
jgi:STE24 endopeptidase